MWSIEHSGANHKDVAMGVPGRLFYGRDRGDHAACTSGRGHLAPSRICSSDRGHVERIHGIYDVDVASTPLSGWPPGEALNVSLA